MAWLYRQKGSKKWWLGYRLAGKQILRSTGTDDKAEAERQLAKVQAMFEAHRTDRLCSAKLILREKSFGIG